jgi:Ca2+-binding RTX toxin-like protein
MMLAVIALSTVVLVSDADPAAAAFPGKNGLLVFSVDGDIAVVRSDGGGFRFLTSGPEDDNDPSWSADGAWIVFVRGGVIHTMRASGAHIRSTGRRGTDPRWFPDGTSIVFDDFDVRTMRPDGTHLRVLFDSTAGQTWQDHYHDASYSHDGTVAVTHTQDAVDSYFSAIETDIGDDCPMNSELAVFSPDGRWLAITGQGQLCVTNGLGEQFFLGEWYTEVAWSPDGRFLATDGEIRIIRPDGTLVRQLAIGGAGIDWRPVCTIRGTPGDDVLYGTAASDVICAFAGNDSVFGSAGGDTVYGGSGDDRIRGDGGGDVLFGGWGSDTIRGGDGPDVLNGGPSSDTCSGGGAVDRLISCSDV